MQIIYLFSLFCRASVPRQDKFDVLLRGSHILYKYINNLFDIASGNGMEMSIYYFFIMYGSAKFLRFRP